MMSDAFYVDAKMRRKDEYYLSIAESIARKSTCLRRKYGAIIVKNDEIISTGYNGSPRGCLNCTETGCMREVIGIGKGDAYNLCISVHAEQNAIISAKRTDMIGATMYIVGIDVKNTNYDNGVIYYADPSPCLLCHRMIINAGIDRVIGIKSGICIYPNNTPNAVNIDVSNLSFMKRMQLEYTKTIDKMDEDVRTRAQIRIAAAGPETQDFTDEEKSEMESIRNARKMITVRDDLIVGTQEDEIYKRYGLTDSEIALLRSGRPLRSVAISTLEKVQNMFKDRLGSRRITAEEIGAVDGSKDVMTGTLPTARGGTGDTNDLYGANHTITLENKLPVHHGNTNPSSIEAMLVNMTVEMNTVLDLPSDHPLADTIRDSIRSSMPCIEFRQSPKFKTLREEMYDSRMSSEGIDLDHPLFTTPNDMVHEELHKECGNITATTPDINNPFPKR